MHDVFISYAHADDEPPLNLSHGWVTTFTEELRKRLRAKVGGSGAKIWMDCRLAANDQVTSTLLESVQASRTLVLFLSQGYQQSHWCQRELGTFLERNESHKNKESVFVVEIDEVNRDQWHHRIRELTPFKFWEKSHLDRAPRLLGYPAPSPSEDNPYWRRLNELAHLIAAHLSLVADRDETIHIQRPIVIGDRIPPPSVKKPVIWAAEPTDDLVERWHELEGAIRQAGGEIRPVSPEYYDRSSQTVFEETVRHDLLDARLLVQLLSGVPGRRIRNSELTYTTLQNSLARAWADQKQLTFVQWRPSELTLEQVSDGSYRQVLTGAIASSFEELRQRVVKSIEGFFTPAILPATSNRPRNERSPQRSTDYNAGEIPPAICINAVAQDRELSLRIAEMLADLGADTLSAPEPSPGQTPKAFNDLLDGVIQNSHGIIIVYGRTNPAWVQAQYTRAKKLLARQRRGIWGALLDGPPSTKPPHGVTSQNLMTLDCRAGIQRDHLARFIDALR